ncbi:MAG: hypothetical protein P8X74_00835 [Reinekea sp.]
MACSLRHYGVTGSGISKYRVMSRAMHSINCLQCRSIFPKTIESRIQKIDSGVNSFHLPHRSDPCRQIFICY